ncbi:MAG: hypothetical protein ACLFQX_08895 [Candidatus Kapaibacterium sp.]
MYRQILIAAIIALALAGCGEGLAPTADDGRTAFGGTIRFIPHDGWPPPDSVMDVRVIAFKKFPPEDIIQAVLSGDAYFVQNSIQYGVDSANYEIEIEEPPETLEYIAVALQFGGIYDWRAIGVYSSHDDFAPDSLHLEAGEVRMDINITVDFNNPPPQPF